MAHVDYKIVNGISLALCGTMALCVLSGCSTGKQIKKADLYGTWYSQDTSFKQVITFEDNGEYKTEAFAPDGTYQINKKTGEIKLVTPDRQVITLAPQKSEDSWELLYTEKEFAPVTFTMDEPTYDESASVENNPYIYMDAFKKRYTMETLAQYLENGTWTTDAGESLEITRDHFKIGDSAPVGYTLVDADSPENGVYTFSCSNADGTYVGRFVMECDDWESFDIKGYSLELILNGTPVFAAHCSEYIRIEQID